MTTTMKRIYRVYAIAMWVLVVIEYDLIEILFELVKFMCLI